MTKNVPTLNQQNINVLIKEIYKFENDLFSPLIDDMFQVRKTNFNLRHFQKIANTKKLSKMSLETKSYRAPQPWNLIPTKIKDTTSLSKVKEKINSRYCDNFQCRSCKTYIASAGFVYSTYFKIWLTTLAFFNGIVFSMSCFIDARCKLVL